MTENAVATKPEKQYQSALAKANDVFVPMITQQLQGNGIEMSNYQRTTVLNAMTAMNTLLIDKGLNINEIDSSNVTNILLTVAALQLNASADPREVYFIVRKHKMPDGKSYKQAIEMGIEGDGNDALLARFGRGIKTVHKFWSVREGDGFEYPKHKGLDVMPPEWTETGRGKVARVVYPITFNSGVTEYYIGEREDVKRNLLAHVSQNLMWDKGTAKADFNTKAADMTLDQILDDPELVKLGKISPAWSSPQSRESMIVRKMRNNVVKKIPKDFSNGFVATEYDHATDDNYKAMRKDVTEHANRVDFSDVPKPKAIEVSTPVPQAPEPEKTADQAVDHETGEITDQKQTSLDIPTDEPGEEDPF
ncbi:hypothetical protein I3F57_06080 [Lacticaseibacillus paracasei subsp. tolerans]|uniref:hypothetical protein n=1 Tax=Lacticaseibacillus paracasei TaxID=1597 RepID=UPI0018AD4E4D|nr:hypothetical protein [Lacticaseibacillus paracasei]QPI89311.1 hypothetical protein I3F57_06080 [Lacticaseibacillus paracasei subsp. tolerans]